MRGERWTPGEIHELRRLAGRGFSISSIAQTMGKTYGAIASQAYYREIEVRTEPRYFENSTYKNGADWEAMAWERLANCYGAARADMIVSGRDPKTQADIAAWNRLGQRSAA